MEEPVLRFTYVAAFRWSLPAPVPFRVSVTHAHTILIAQDAELLARDGSDARTSTVGTERPRQSSGIWMLRI